MDGNDRNHSKEVVQYLDRMTIFARERNSARENNFPRNFESKTHLKNARHVPKRVGTRGGEVGARTKLRST